VKITTEILLQLVPCFPDRPASKGEETTSCARSWH